MPTSKQVKQRIKQTDARIRRLNKELNDAKKSKVKLASDLKKAATAEKKTASKKKAASSKRKAKKKTTRKK